MKRTKSCLSKGFERLLRLSASDHFQTLTNNTQHVATHRNKVAKRTQHVAPNNVGICCVEML